MNPLHDEKIILATSAAVMEVGSEWLQLNIFREAYGLTANEGLCHEYCAQINIDGILKGSLFVGMDGYTKILLLPYILKKYELENPKPEITEASILSFVNQLAGRITSDLTEIGLELGVSVPTNVSHKLISLPTEDYRKYMIIFFIKDEVKKIYIGRIYFYIALQKNIKINNSDLKSL